MIKDAQERLKGVAQKTGLSYSNSVSDLAGCEVYLKLENLQRTGSFKLRGAYNKVASLTPEEREKGVIAASAGNHAQGVALAASEYGCQSVICMPKHAPLSKITATRGYGANVVLYGDFFDEAAAKAVELTTEHGYTFVHPSMTRKSSPARGRLPWKSSNSCLKSTPSSHRLAAAASFPAWP